MKLVALEDLAGGDTIREPHERGQCGSQPLLLGTSPQTLLVDLRRREEADCLRGNLSMTRPYELVQPVDEDVFGRKDERRPTRREPNLRDFFGGRRKARGCFDEEVVLGIDPVPPFTMQPKLRETIVDSRSVREIEIDVSGRIRSASPELDCNAANDDRTEAQPAYEIVDESCNPKLSLRLVVKSEHSLELRARVVHDWMLGKPSAG